MSLKGVSMFSSAGIGELLFNDVGINIVAANEIIVRRAELYKSAHPKTDMIIGDINDEIVFKNFLNAAGSKIDFLIASPPCQGMSIAGKNRSVDSMVNDERNHLILRVIEAIKTLDPEIAIIENVPALLKLVLFYKEKLSKIEDILSEELGFKYTIESKVVDAADYGIPQVRKRAIIKLYKKNIIWPWPNKENKISVYDAIGHLPSLEAGEKSDIKWHFARKHDSRHILWMQQTPTGKSAFENELHYPRKINGEKIKGYNTTYRRIKWEEPAPTITIRNDAISSQKNVHPGRQKKDGTYSDARVLTPLELMILNSIPTEWNIPIDTPEILIRQCIGESIPPLLLKKILKEISYVR